MSEEKRRSFTLGIPVSIPLDFTVVAPLPLRVEGEVLFLIIDRMGSGKVRNI
jgi:hypothetical protein